MYKLYKIDAVHDVLKRVLKSNLKDDKMVELYKELQNAGYEDKNIDVEVTHKFHEEGDLIAITKNQFDKLPDNENYDNSRHSKLTIEERKKANAKRSIKHIFGDNPNFPLKAELQAFRLSNDNGHLIAVWENPTDERFKTTATHFLEDLGFEFEQPEFEVIPIAETDNSLLNTSDLIVKYLIKENNWTEERALDYLKPVLKAMNKAEAVFYQP